METISTFQTQLINKYNLLSGADKIRIQIKITAIHPLFFRGAVDKKMEGKELDLDGRLSFEEFMGEQSRA